MAVLKNKSGNVREKLTIIVDSVFFVRSANTAAIRRDLVRFIRDFEDRNEGRLLTWEEACRFAGEAADAMSPLIAAA